MKEMINQMKYKHIDFDIPKDGNILLWVSGGADSAAGLYLIVKEIIDKNLNTKVVCSTWRRPWPSDNPRDWNITHAKKVISKVCELVGRSDIIIDHLLFDEPFRNDPEEYIDEGRWVTAFDSVKVSHNTQAWFTFLTQNPPMDEMVEYGLLEEREEERDEGIVHKILPFGRVDKSFVKGIYDEFDLLTTLLPETRSCEGPAEDTNNYTTACEWCWWCREKYWAFKEY